MTRVYTQADSDEVRRAFREKLKDPAEMAAHKNRKTLITKKEWAQFSRQGRDMSKYEVWQDFMSRARKEDATNRKHLRDITK